MMAQSIDVRYIDPSEDSSDGVSIRLFEGGPLEGWVTIEIPGGGHTGSEIHDVEEVGIVLSGLVEVSYDTGFNEPSHLVTDDRYRVGAKVKHRLTAKGEAVKILARFEG